MAVAEPPCEHFRAEIGSINADVALFIFVGGIYGLMQGNGLAIGDLFERVLLDCQYGGFIAGEAAGES